MAHMTGAEFEALKADTVARAERGNRGELTPAEREQTRDDIGRVLAEAKRRIDEWKTTVTGEAVE